MPRNQDRERHERHDERPPFRDEPWTAQRGRPLEDRGPRDPLDRSAAGAPPPRGRDREWRDDDRAHDRRDVQFSPHRDDDRGGVGWHGIPSGRDLGDDLGDHVYGARDRDRDHDPAQRPHDRERDWVHDRDDRSGRSATERARFEDARRYGRDAGGGASERGFMRDDRGPVHDDSGWGRPHHVDRERYGGRVLRDDERSFESRRHAMTDDSHHHPDRNERGWSGAHEGRRDADDRWRQGPPRGEPPRFDARHGGPSFDERHAERGFAGPPRGYGVARGPERSFDRSRDDRGFDRRPDRGPARVPDRGPDRGPDRRPDRGSNDAWRAPVEPERWGGEPFGGEMGQRTSGPPAERYRHERHDRGDRSGPEDRDRGSAYDDRVAAPWRPRDIR